MIDRVPPQNIEAEQAVLGAMLISKEAIAESAQILNPQDFYREAHRIVFEAMLDLSNRNQAVDNLTVIEQLNKTNQLTISFFLHSMPYHIGQHIDIILKVVRRHQPYVIRVNF